MGLNSQYKHINKMKSFKRSNSLENGKYCQTEETRNNNELHRDLTKAKLKSMEVFLNSYFFQ